MASHPPASLLYFNQMLLDQEICERARRSRDPRFDGRFFIGVTSTGIYCRPICPAPSPKEENVRYYPSAAAAAEAGFRPCLRCRLVERGSRHCRDQGERGRVPERIFRQFELAFASGKRFGFVVQAEGLNRGTRSMIEEMNKRQLAEDPTRHGYRVVGRRVHREAVERKICSVAQSRSSGGASAETGLHS